MLATAAAGLIVVVVALRFAHTLSEPLTYADTGESVYLVEQVLPEHHGLSDVWRWAHARWPMFAGSNYYRPLSMLSFVLDWRLWGTEAFGYRLTSLVLLIGCALAFTALATRLMGAWGWLAGLLWAWAPGWAEHYYPLSTAAPLFVIQAKSATWVIARPDLLAALFCLLAVRWLAEKGRAMWGFGACFAAALLCKESAIPLAAVVTVYALLEDRPWSHKWRHLVLTWVLLAAYLGLRQAALGVTPLAQAAQHAVRPETSLRWLAMFALGPAIRATGILIEIARSAWILLVPRNLFSLLQAAVYFFLLYFLLRYQIRQWIFWVGWGLLFLVAVIRLPVFWAWGHYWLLPSFAGPALLALGARTVWQEMVAPRLAPSAARSGEARSPSQVPAR